MQKRDLSTSEQKIVGFLRSYYNLVDIRRLTGVLFMTGRALEVITERGIAKTLKVDWDKEQKLYSVTFTLSELKTYIDFCVLNQGMRVEIDGTVILFDGFRINLYKVNS